MFKRLLFIFAILFPCYSFAGEYREYNKSFGSWLVSCKENLMTAKNDCFIGTQFKDDTGRGAIVFTRYYLAVAHNELNLSQGINFTIDNNKGIESYMNTGVNVFFKNEDRKKLASEMQKGISLLIDIKNFTKVKKSLQGFSEAYTYYLSQI